jgi:fucose permease
MSFMGMSPFGSLLAGALAARIGVNSTLLWGGTLCIIAAIIYTTLLPKFRSLVRPLYVEKGIIDSAG